MFPTDIYTYTINSLVHRATCSMRQASATVQQAAGARSYQHNSAGGRAEAAALYLCSKPAQAATFFLGGGAGMVHNAEWSGYFSL